LPEKKLDVSQRLHRALYPEQYREGYKPRLDKKTMDVRRKETTKPISEKWAPVMKQKSVEKKLSKQFGVPVFTPSASNIKKTCPNPVATVTASQTTLLDPTGARTRLFAKDNPECARVGDILLVRQRTGDPFAGVCINIRRRGVDTAILLRGQLTRVGVEMWYKVYSPLVEGIEVVQRAAKRARRARLTYMRLVKHDRGSVENVVRMYLRQKAALGTAEGQKKKGAGAAAAMMGGKKKGRGKKR
jgi:ribosomal protein L19